jgi:hypothetical protein
MEQFNVIFHTPYDVTAQEKRSFKAYIDDKSVSEETANSVKRIYETLHRVSSNAVSLAVTAESIEEAVAKAHRCLGWGHYEHVTVINALSVVAEYRHRVSVSQELDRII